METFAPGRRGRVLAAVLFLIVAGCAVLPDSDGIEAERQGRTAFASSVGAPKPAEQVRETARVYLLRGLWEVFSLGLDELAAKLRAEGHDAVVQSHAAWPWIADTLIEQRRLGGHRGPIVLIGHSLGADNAIRIARRLDEAGIQVDMLITFDPVFPPEAPPNVVRLVNYFQHGTFWGKPVVAGAGFKGVLDNADLDRTHGELRESVGHMTMDKSAELHAEVIGAIAALRGPALAGRTSHGKARRAVAVSAGSE